MIASRLRSRACRRAACLAVCLGLYGRAAGAADRAPLIASRDDAFVSHQEGSDLWTIGGARLELTVGFDASRALAVQQLVNPETGRAWDITPGPDVTLTAGGQRIALTSSGAVSFVAATAQSTDRGVTLTFLFEDRADRLLLSRVYACYPGSPTIEPWTRIISTGGEPVALADLVGWQLTMPLGRVRWLGGLRGDGADAGIEDAFVVVDRDLEPAERVEIGSEGRSSETFLPLLFVDGEQDEFYGGLMWSGAWHAALERAGDRLRVGVFFPGVSTIVTVSRAVELPHTFFGVKAHAASNESAALRAFIMNGIRGGRPFQPLVTYNTWFAYGTRITEDLIVAEMDRAAAIGVELFVMDAGWYLGAGATGDFDFDSGLGSWTADADRFPSGLPSLADYAHGLGMKFGIWIEPERVALSTVDQPGLAREAWLATHGGSYGAAQAAQICLVHPEAHDWVLGELVALMERVRPDYVKWDNNFWINCNREGHGHGAADGNLAHVQSLYGILDELRTRYPDLMIENVSGGGSRLDFGMLAYTDTAWMDDRTAPAALVRHNLEGLTFAFPPAYLLSFLIDGDGEPIAGAEDFPLLTRSRMPGILGLTYRTELVDDATAALLAEQIAQWKAIRGTVAAANASLLSEQSPVDESSWDVLQEVADGGRTALLFAFKGSAAPGRTTVRPQNLLAAVTYDVTSLDAGALGAARGDALMLDGIEVVHATGSRAHLIVLKARD